MSYFAIIAAQTKHWIIVCIYSKCDSEQKRLLGWMVKVHLLWTPTAQYAITFTPTCDFVIQWWSWFVVLSLASCPVCLSECWCTTSEKTWWCWRHSGSVVRTVGNQIQLGHSWGELRTYEHVLLRCVPNAPKCLHPPPWPLPHISLCTNINTSHIQSVLISNSKLHKWKLSRSLTWKALSHFFLPAPFIPSFYSSSHTSV